MSEHRLLVTGATGFIGRWTVRHWSERRPTVDLWGLSDRDRPSWLPESRYRQVDLRDADAVRAFVAESQPTEVIHLAGSIGAGTLADHLNHNVLATESLMSALAELEGAAEVRVVLASSASVYGIVSDKDLPLRETRPLRPVTPYALSKAAQELLGIGWRARGGIQVMVARLFNVLGPEQPRTLVPATFLEQVMDIAKGRSSTFSVGNTSPERDFIDVRDVAGAFDALLERGRMGEIYNVGSGRSLSIGEVIGQLIEISGMDIAAETHASRLRKNDVACVRADISKITTETGFTPSISIRRSLEDMWQDLKGRDNEG